MLSRRLAEHVARTGYDDLPASTRAAARRALLDGIGVMLGASGVAEVAPFIALARAKAGGGQSAVLGHGFSVDPAAAALTNGAMAHALDFEDAFDAAPCHPNASLLPAALAVAGARNIGGRDLIAAVAIGCDLVCRLALSLRRPMEEGGWYPPPILGAFGATAAAAKLLGLDARGILDAWSLMLAQNSCPGEIKYAPASTMRAIREAFPAQAAVVSAQLAAGGVCGFDQPFEGRAGFFRLFVDGQFDESALLEGLGAHFLIEALTFKRWPCCRGTHAYIEAIERIRARAPVPVARIRRVTLRGGGIQRMLAEPLPSKQRPETAIDAKFSLPFTTATAIVRGEVDLDSFAPDRLADAALLAMAARIDFVEEAGLGRTGPAGGTVEIELDDGALLREQIDIARGHPDRPLDEAELHAKFASCAARAARPIAISPADAAAWIERLEGADSVAAWLASLR
jgi:2-methylcitrate dehydratase PrpD